MCRLTKDMELVAQVIGVELTHKLMREMAGISVYIPVYKATYDDIARALKENAFNAKVAAKQCHVSEKTVQRISRDVRFKQREQSLFDDID